VTVSATVTSPVTVVVTVMVSRHPRITLPVTPAVFLAGGVVTSTVTVMKVTVKVSATVVTGNARAHSSCRKPAPVVF